MKVTGINIGRMRDLLVLGQALLKIVPASDATDELQNVWSELWNELTGEDSVVSIKN